MLQEYIVTQGESLVNIAARYLGGRCNFGECVMPVRKSEQHSFRNDDYWMITATGDIGGQRQSQTLMTAFLYHSNFIAYIDPAS